MESGRVPEARPAADAPALRPKVERFGRYYLLERIGKGGMAEVFRAVTLGLEGFRRMFVVKRILAEKSNSPEFVQMFCDEARISALLHHPNVVQVYDFGHVGGSYFIAMEYLLGKDLSSVMRVLRASKLAVPPTMAAFIAQQIATGLHYAHALRGANGKPLGIVHRDVTPSNIMLLQAGGVKILDFGVAKATALANHSPRTSGGFLKGKLGYVSPEQARSGEVDARSDVFSLGVTLWEMLAGKRLFAGSNELETLSNVLKKPVPAPSTLQPGISPELDAVVARALDRDRDRRYQGADELARDLEQIVRDGRYESQSLRRLLDELFGEESSNPSVDVPEELAALAAPTTPTASPPDGPSGAPAPVTAAAPASDGVAAIEIEIAEASAPRTRPRTRSLAPPFGVAATSDFALPRPDPVPWSPPRRIAVGAAIAAALALASLGAFSAARHARTARVTMPAAVVVRTLASALPPPPPAPVTPAAHAEIKLELDSNPRGAVVSDADGDLLGTTPVTLTLPHSDSARTFTLAKPGWRSATYQLAPGRDAVAFIELQHEHSATSHHSKKRGGRDLGDGMTINPF